MYLNVLILFVFVIIKASATWVVCTNTNRTVVVVLYERLGCSIGALFAGTCNVRVGGFVLPILFGSLLFVSSVYHGRAVWQRKI